MTESHEHILPSKSQPGYELEQPKRKGRGGGKRKGRRSARKLGAVCRWVSCHTHKKRLSCKGHLHPSMADTKQPSTEKMRAGVDGKKLKSDIVLHHPFGFM